jgi:hypothetical protein
VFSDLNGGEGDSLARSADIASDIIAVLLSNVDSTRLNIFWDSRRGDTQIKRILPDASSCEPSRPIIVDFSESSRETTLSTLCFLAIVLQRRFEMDWSCCCWVLLLFELVLFIRKISYLCGLVLMIRGEFSIVLSLVV